MRRPLCWGVMLWLALLAFLYFVLGVKPVKGYDALAARLDRETVILTGRVRRITAAGSERTYWLDHIKMDTDEEEAHALENVTFAGETEQDSPVLIPAGLCVLVRSEDAGLEESGIAPSDTLRVRGKASFPAEPTNPGQFDDPAYCAARGILFRIYEGEIIRTEQGHGPARYLQLLSERLSDSYRAGLTGEEAAILRGITLGDTGEITADTRGLFQEGGIAHILAVSALHVNLVAMSLYRLLRRRGVPIMLCVPAASFVLWLYLVLTGMSLSAVRAFVMFLIWGIAQSSGRRTDLPTSLAAAALFLTLRHPALVEEGSFYLSFGCVLSLHFLSGPILAGLNAVVCRAPGRPVWVRRLLGALASSLAVSLGTLPICCLFYRQITPWAFLVNLPVLPCMGFLFAFGALGGMLGMVHPGPGRFLLAVCHYLLGAFTALCKAARLLPFGVVITGRPVLWQVAAYYLLLGAAVHMAKGKRKKRGRERRKARVPAPLLAALALVVLLVRARPVFRAVFLDVGQGDCILVQLRGHAFLVDCGSSSVEDVWSRRVSPALKYFGISHLDGIFISHGDSDHISGFRALFDAYERNMLGDNIGDVSVDAVFVSGPGIGADRAALALAGQAQGLQIPVMTLWPSDQIRLGKDTALTCLYPGEEDVAAAAGDVNMASLVLRVQDGDTRLYLTGDLEKEGETRLLGMLEKEGKAEGGLTVLKVGHHGSRNATSPELLGILAPDEAVISCGKNNRYGHPAGRVLEDLAKAGCRIRRTDRDGAVMIWLKKLICLL